MTTVQNNITSNTTLNTDTAGVNAPQPMAHDAKSLMAKAKATIKAMNIAEARSRKAVAEMVASFVEMGEAYISDKDVTSGIDAECKKHGIDPVNLSDAKWKDKNPNIFLPMMSIVDGRWVNVVNPTTGKPVKKDGKIKQKWARNRSFEKYASVTRFFIHNGISHDKVVDILMGEDVIKIDGFKDGVRPRISDIVAADTVQQNGERRKTTIWTEDAKTAVAVFEPVAKIKLTDDVEKSLKLSDGYAALIIRVENGELSILFDSGLEGDALFRLINKRVATLNEAYEAKDDEAA